MEIFGQGQLVTEPPLNPRGELAPRRSARRKLCASARTAASRPATLSRGRIGGES